jgi:hypothetical protein
MNDKIKKIAEKIIWAMSNFRPMETGLPMVIWVNPKTGLEKHGPRIKVQKEHGSKSQLGNWASVTISKNPEVRGKLSPQDAKLVFAFIEENLENLLSLWNDEISPLEFGSKIKKIK